MVRFGAQQAVIRAAVVRQGRETLVELELTPSGRANRARLNKSPLPRTRDVLGTLRTVLGPGRISPWSRATRRCVAPSSTTCRAPTALVGRARATTTGSSNNATPCSSRPPRSCARRANAGMPCPAPPTAPPTGPPPATTPDSPDAPDATAARTGIDPTIPDFDDPVVSALHTLDVRNHHLAEVGAQLLYARLRLLRDLAPFLRTAYREVSAGVSEAAVSGQNPNPEPKSKPLAAVNALLMYNGRQRGSQELQEIGSTSDRRPRQASLPRCTWASTRTPTRTSPKCQSKKLTQENERYKALFSCEIKIMHTINHPNIIHLHELLESTRSSTW